MGWSRITSVFYKDSCRRCELPSTWRKPQTPLLEVAHLMAPIRRYSLVLLAAAFLGFALPAQAAPAPADEQPKVHKFLPDDSGGVFLVNIKQIVASPLYTKNFQKQVDELLKKDEVQTI